VVALGTLDRSPPPFFKQGPSAFTRLMFFSSLAVFLMVADVRFQMTRPLRAAAATLLHPLQQVLLTPLEWSTHAGAYLSGLDEARAARLKAEKTLAAQAERVMRADQLARENASLRELLALKPRVSVRAMAAEVLYDAPDPYTRKIVINQGSGQGVVLGAPVLDQHGVMGQVTRVYNNAAWPMAPHRPKAWSCASWLAMPMCRWETSSAPRGSMASIRRACPWPK